VSAPDCSAKYAHNPKLDETCSLLCTCPTPLTQAEADLLGDLGLF
jgi:hypothetical protein